MRISHGSDACRIITSMPIFPAYRVKDDLGDWSPEKDWF